MDQGRVQGRWGLDAGARAELGQALGWGKCWGGGGAGLAGAGVEQALRGGRRWAGPGQALTHLEMTLAMPCSQSLVL